MNIFSSHLLAMFNNISVWWHVVGASAVVLILIFMPDHHQSVNDVFTDHRQQHRVLRRETTGCGFLFYVLPLSVILTQYTITGYDASAHLSEETHSAADSAAKGIWRSIFYSAIGGWILLLAFLFAVQNVADVTQGRWRRRHVIFSQALSTNWASTVLAISTIGQFFCTVACMTSCTRMLFAFSRDGAVPGAPALAQAQRRQGAVQRGHPDRGHRGHHHRAGLLKVDINGAPVPVAFFAVVTIGVVGLYVAFAIPIYLRWRAGDSFKPGRVEPGQQVEVDGTDRRRRDRDHVASSRCCRAPRQRSRGTDGVRLEVRELHADRRVRRCSCAHHRSGGTCRPRTGSPDRRRRSTCLPA